MATARWTEKDLARFEQNSGRAVNPEAAKEIARGLGLRSRPNKYGAHATVKDNIRFDSKLEAKRYGELVLMERAGEVLFFLRQVRFPLPGHSHYKADFVVFLPHADGKTMDGMVRAVNMRVEDCKGYETEAGKMRIRQVEEIYDLKVLLLRKPRERKPRASRK